jgi:hypothetical protein
MVGRARASRRATWVAIVLAAGCGSSGLKVPMDATEPSADTSTDAQVDSPVMPADRIDLCPGQPGCGVLSLERVADCTYAFSVAPLEPTNVGVFFAGDGGITKIPRDSQDRDGWDYVDGTSTSIRLFGSWCDEDRAGRFGPPTVIAGCPGICIP